MDFTDTALDFMAVLDGTATCRDLAASLGVFFGGFGLIDFGLIEARNPHQPQHIPGALVLAAESGRAWQDHWMSSNYICADPVILGALSGTRSFFLHDLRPHQKGVAARIMDEATEFGRADGLCVPIHRPNALPGIALLTTSERLDLSAAQTKLLQFCAFQAYHKLEELTRPGPSLPSHRLSQREREALLWIAAGKSAPDIAHILSLSNHTVRGYLKSAMRKLNATTHAQAVALAIRHGEILP